MLFVQSRAGYRDISLQQKTDKMFEGTGGIETEPQVSIRVCFLVGIHCAQEEEKSGLGNLLVDKMIMPTRPLLCLPPFPRANIPFSMEGEREGGRGE